ncbi:MAG: hypothetical protein JXR03_06130 [Cyclobacteriaceae bacterium]
MKLHPQEFLDISALFDKYDLGDRVSFIKRKGWVHVIVDALSIEFHRKKVSSIIDGHFQDSLQYFVRCQGEVTESPDWEGVLTKLDLWIRNNFVIY